MCDSCEVHVQQRVLQASEREAAHLREHFAASGTLVLNLISSPGSGKTTLLEKTAEALKGQLKLGVLVGDVATDRDARRLAALGIPAHQILTGGACHLDARQLHGALGEVGADSLDILFVENVGNLVCPTTYDLGEDFKVSLLSVTEGDDKPFKYPSAFANAAVTVVSKMDLLPHCTFDLAAVENQVKTLNPAARLLALSCRTGEGLTKWLDYLRAALAAKRAAPRPVHGHAHADGEANDHGHPHTHADGTTHDH